MPSPPELPESLDRAARAFRERGGDAQEIAWKLLEQIDDDNAGAETLIALKKELDLQGDELERVLLWHAAGLALARLPSQPIDAAVRALQEQDLRQLHTLPVPMEAGSYAFTRAAKMATLRRFTAGPMEWALSGIPRSWFAQAGLAPGLRLLAFVISRLRGTAPCLFMHVAPAPRNRALRVPKEVLRAYYRMAKSLARQPEARAIVASAWFHDPAAVKDYPHLEVLNEPYVKHGGFITTLGPASASSGVLEGNAQRSADYLAGKVRYKIGLAIWPRDAAIRWAKEHPELGD